MSLTENVDGYAIETTFADGTTIDGAGDTAHQLGQLATKNIWPSATFTMNYQATGVNSKEAAAGTPFKSQGDLRGQITLMMQNGVPIWLTMGSTSTVDADPIFTHTITPRTDGLQLPSIVLQHEEKGSGTNEEYQFQGVKIDSLLLSHDMKTADMLMAKLEVIASKPIDPAFALTNKPALPAVANADPYQQLVSTWDTGGTPVELTGIEKIEIAVANGLTPIYANSYDSVTGAYTGQWCRMMLETERKQYQIQFWMHPNTRVLWDDLKSTNTLTDATFKWSRGPTANDYIEVTALDCAVIKHETITEKVKTLKIVEVILEPRALSFEVKDGVAGIPHYGES